MRIRTCIDDDIGLARGNLSEKGGGDRHRGRTGTLARHRLDAIADAALMTPVLAADQDADDLGWTRWPGRRTPADSHQRKQANVSDSKLIQVTDAADAALAAFDFSDHEGKGVRVFLQGFG